MGRTCALLLASLPVAIGEGTFCSQDASYCDGSFSGVLLSLGYSSLSGTVPTQIGLLSKLSNQLFLNDNSISGTLPTQIGQMSLAFQLYLYSNSISGTLPSQLGQLTQLSGPLYLSSNALSGAIPTQLGGLEALSGLTTYGNKFSGQVPSQLARLSVSRCWLTNSQRGLSATDRSSFDCPIPTLQHSCFSGLPCTWAPPSPPALPPPPAASLWHSTSHHSFVSLSIAVVANATRVTVVPPGHSLFPIHGIRSIFIVPFTDAGSLASQGIAVGDLLGFQRVTRRAPTSLEFQTLSPVASVYAWSLVQGSLHIVYA